MRCHTILLQPLQVTVAQMGTTTRLLLMDIMEGTTHDNLVAKTHSDHIAEHARSHGLRVHAPRWRMCQRRLLFDAIPVTRTIRTLHANLASSATGPLHTVTASSGRWRCGWVTDIWLHD